MNYSIIMRCFLCTLPYFTALTDDFIAQTKSAYNGNNVTIHIISEVTIADQSEDRQLNARLL